MAARLLPLALAALSLGACATVSPGLSGLPFTVSKPDGPGPFPAIVLMHDCSGLGTRSSGAPGRWALDLVQQGYVNSPTGRGATTGGDAAAWADSIREVRAFFGRHLK